MSSVCVCVESVEVRERRLFDFDYVGYCMLPFILCHFFCSGV